MISYLKGRITDKSTSSITVECGGLGFEASVSGNTLNTAGAVGADVTLYTKLVMREDGISFYGFASKSEKNMFERLVTVSGVGPKAAMAVLSVLTPEDLAIALATGDAASIARAPGIGKKTAQRMILELKDKITNEELVSPGVSPVMSGDPVTQDAIAALISLGFGAPEAAKAVAAVRQQSDKTDELILLALRTGER